jgi:hypothetical protein
MAYDLRRAENSATGRFLSGPFVAGTFGSGTTLAQLIG